jgi:citrate lyase subunit alpha/citrate CoA-transferase
MTSRCEPGPKLVERAGCITAPGETIDAVVTEAGVAVYPQRGDLAERLRSAGNRLARVATTTTSRLSAVA